MAEIHHDDAGTRIITYAASAPEHVPTWSTSEEPVLQIGSLDGRPEYMFTNARTARSLSDGRLVVPDLGSGEIRFYDAGGEYLKSVGGRGRGPGEFQQLVWLEVAGDSILTWDMVAQSFSVLDQQGSYHRSVTPPRLGAGFYQPFGRWSSGDWLLLWKTFTQPDAPSPRLVRESAYVIRYSESRQELDTIANLSDYEVAIHPGPRGRPSLATPLISRTGRFAGVEDRFVHGPGERFEISVFERDSIAQVIIHDRPLARVSSDDLRQARERRLAGVPEAERPWQRKQLMDLPAPETLPAHGRIVMTTAGGIWVEEYAPSEADVSWQWFARDGAWKGTVVTPRNFTVTEVGSDYVLGIARDEFDVQYVRRYALRQHSGEEAQ